MIKDNLDKNLEIYFAIKVPMAVENPSEMRDYNHIFSILKFESSNYDLSRDEILRASLKPNQLVLDDNYIYVKSNERAYVNHGKNILKINYIRSNNHLG
jgi:hypothetical protein